MKYSMEQSPTTSLALLRSLWSQLSRQRQRQVGLLLMIMGLSACAEVVSLGVILPFLGVLAAPDKVFEFPFAGALAELMGITRADQLVMPLAIFFVVAVLAAGGLRLLLLYTNARLSQAIGHDLCVEVYRRTLYQPYHVHVARNTSEVLSGVGKAKGLVRIMQNLLNVMTAIFIGLFIITALFLINPLVALVSFLILGTIYLCTTRLTRRRLQLNGQLAAAVDVYRLKALREGLAGIRDVLLDGTQSVYTNIFRSADLRVSVAQATNTFLSRSPQYVVEMIGMVVITLVAFGLSRQPGGFAAALPVLGAFALGARRLLPSLQQLYSGWAVVKSNQASLMDAMALLMQPISDEYSRPPPAPLSLRRAIEFQNVSFRYQANGPWVLDGVSFIIPKGTHVGIIGVTGSGKSTAIDLLLGLLQPCLGDILIDGERLTAANRRAWQQGLAHVPQSIYLSDVTLAENIAFGVPADTIDLKQVREAARQAQIADFIETTPNGYDTRVGERGVRLSGGQRQRIGIARALYKQAAVLVFDEATSALDDSTEAAVIEAIEGLNPELTIIMIAHRLTTLRGCDHIVQFEQGRVVATGSYGDLARVSTPFPLAGQRLSAGTRPI